MNRYEQAIDGISVVASGGVVLVEDGATTWLCDESTWDAVAEQLSELGAITEDDEGGSEAYGQLCAAVCRASAVASVDGGSCHGDAAAQADLVRRALATELIDAEMAARMLNFLSP